MHGDSFYFNGDHEIYGKVERRNGPGLQFRKPGPFNLLVFYAN